MDYWRECIEEAFEELNIQASKDQIEQMIEWVKINEENMGMYMGLEASTKGALSPEAIALNDLKKEIDKKEMWVSTTNPCHHCLTNGWVGDDKITCYLCGGSGRVRKHYHN